MDQIILDLTDREGIQLVATVAGELRLTGWDQPQFSAESDEDNSLRVDHTEDTIRLSSSSDCNISLPRWATVTVERVGGDAKVKSLDGPVQLGVIGGDLSLRQVGAVGIRDAVGGDLKAKKVSGPLHINRVGGDASVSSVEGDFVAGTVGGDLYLRAVEGPIAAKAGGDVRLSVEFAPGHRYQVQAGTDIVCRLAPGTSGRFTIRAGSEISVDVPGAQIMGEPRRKVVVVGEGETEVLLEAGSDVSLVGPGGDPEAMGDFGEHFGEDFGMMAEEFAASIESQIETQMADLERQLQEKLAGINLQFGAGSSKAEELAAKVRRAAERAEQAARRKEEAARRRVERIQRQAEREAERARRLAEAAQRRAEAAAQRAAHRHGRHGLAFNFVRPTPPTPPVPPTPPRGPGAPRPPAPPTPPSDPVTDEERMMILRMVEQGKITVQDAEKLLAALENR